MKRIKSAPANIAEMVNRKKLVSEKPTSKLPIITAVQEKQQVKPTGNFITPIKNKIVYSKTQKNIEKTVNNVMLDYLDASKQQFNANDEEVVIISILYYYICEKIFTKKNMNEFMLFLVQTIIKYLFTHKLHEFIITGNNEFITHNIALLLHKL
jgi:hypothetical protein